MRKFVFRNICVILIASLLITGTISPLVRFMPKAVQRIVATQPAYAWTFGLDTVISLLAGLGGVGVAIVVTVAFTGVAGGGALMAALFAWGGPFGVLGGIMAMGGIAILGKGLADEGLNYILERMARKWKSDGKSLSEIEREIDDLPSLIFNDNRKEEVKRSIRPYMR